MTAKVQILKKNSQHPNGKNQKYPHFVFSKIQFLPDFMFSKIQFVSLQKYKRIRRKRQVFKTDFL